MADSPTRRSSIPILKQSNKTKSFQSYVSLNFEEQQQQQQQPPQIKCRSPSSISSLSPPILEYPKLPPRPPSRSFTQNQTPKLEIDNDIIITKLCDENKRLKEHQTQLMSKYEEALRENMDIQNKNDELQRELVHARREISEKIHLQKTIENLQKQQLDVVEKNKKLQKKLEEILPESIKDYEVSQEATKNDMQNIMGELEKLKSYLNNVELQLYEANEHISDLLEKKQELEVENLSLKSQNAELNNLTKLMQSNMYETLSTSKRMEETFLRVKTERDELMKRQYRDSIDSGNSRGSSEASTDDIVHLKNELSLQKKAYEAQFIEYRREVEAEVQEQISAEVESLKIQMQMLESELTISRMRADNAEEELRQLKATLRMSDSNLVSQMDCASNASATTEKHHNETAPPSASLPPPPPPPPPPPMPNLFPNALSNISRSRSQSVPLIEAIGIAQQNLIQNGGEHDEHEVKKATGLAAVIDDLKSGRVTLRRRQHAPRAPISPPKKDLSHIYNLLEKNKTQNRSSIKILDNELSMAFQKFNLKF